MVTTTSWVLLREYASTFEAEFELAVLEEHDFPVLVHGPPVGVFGPGFAAATATGVRIMVPADRREEAEELLRFGTVAEAPVEE